MCTVLLPPGVNPIAVNTDIYIDIYVLTAIGLSPGGSTHLRTNNT